MPFLSIIIPTHNNEEHIEQAINSCFDSDFDDLEVIVVNDASTDNTYSIIKKIQERNSSKITIINSKKNNGPGETRNLGINIASGAYLMFLDGDDWYEPNALEIVAKKLKETKADVLMFNHQRTWPNGVKIANIPNKYISLSTTQENLSEPQARSNAIKNIHSACNKAYKHTYINDINMKFPTGWYEDLHWSILSIIKAPTIHYIGDVIFNYRQRDNSITKTLSNKHFDIFNKFNQIIEHINKDESLLIYKNDIYTYARLQIFGVYRSGIRIKKEKKILFLKKTKDFLKQHSPKKRNLNEHFSHSNNI